ncbi:MAG TPA: hypothetical protein DHW71_06550 [Gammaproteobacteria bacterium]|nr:hypothetical protein [Gammaproteobacteria bacterium]MEC8010733.1 hypothetical protein [Pseudomonadota bacterium]HBF09179.1 hypothetical protein [Gammaproteobacteria bacterium]HCK92625.1 hypothetical protein [Gammaproteobacteria bacterium]|tara:strand:- start:247 stop:561 length:315 start_codon:yes stop_codon:yes gene_type:complete
MYRHISISPKQPNATEDDINHVMQLIRHLPLEVFDIPMEDFYVERSLSTTGETQGVLMMALFEDIAHWKRYEADERRKAFTQTLQEYLDFSRVTSAQTALEQGF